MSQVNDPKPERRAPAYWRSLSELENTPEFSAFLKREFPGIKSEELNEHSRRRFLQLMGASIALASATGCWKEDKVVPAATGDSSIVPGVPKHFATAMEIGGVAQGLVVTSFDGRPVKIEGNPAHPESLGATDAFAQAATLELYDPDRSIQPLKKTAQGLLPAPAVEFTAFAKQHFAGLKGTEGIGLCVLHDATTSESFAAAKAQFMAAYPKAEFTEYEPVSYDNERAGAVLAFGEPLRAVYKLKDAKVLLALDSDFLAQHPSSLRLAREYSAGRRPNDGNMSRLYAVESIFSATGAAADHRLAIPSSQVGAFASALAIELRGKTTQPATLTSLVPSGEWSDEAKKFLGALAKDLAANIGTSVVVAGPRQPAEVHALAFALNSVLGNIGKTVTFVKDPAPTRPAYGAAIATLASKIEKGEVNTLVILGGNPVYDAPADLKFGDKLAKVATVIQHSLYFNETTQSATWHLPRAHFLESWGDARAWDGTLSVVQPLILPLYGALSSPELLCELAGAGKKGYELTRTALKGLFKADFESGWRKTVHDGVAVGTAYPEVTPALKLAELKLPAPTVEKGELEIVFPVDSKVYDGRFANNGWLQELPDYMTKLTWDNALLVAPVTAQRLGVLTKDQVTVSYGGNTVDAVVYTMPGQARDSISLTLGYGRSVAGHVGGFTEKRIDSPGFNAYKLRSSANLAFGTGVTVTKTGKTFELAVTQDHWAIDQAGKDAIADRLGELVREFSAEEYAHLKDHENFARHVVHHPPLEQLFAEVDYTENNRWGIAIDLNVCTGCTSCIVACQSENNIPIVGKDQVIRGREMHWLRLDRYFKGDYEGTPEVVHQPVMCQQCENAPCEQVCPVAATMHSHEGLNEMVYNRCIGTRYCSNNCPYKVRRFNFFDWNKPVRQDPNDVRKMVFNPEVTVRMRGVMEKCTFCVQRIQNVKIKHRNAGERDGKRVFIKDGEIKSACQQACPADAIVFGDLNDPESRVAKMHAESRGYEMLAELNVRPRVTYLAKIRNPHPDLVEEGTHEHAGHGGH
jgi:MoCo/4Fe-4S cofactor protein with predicted Tat translocation signal